MAKRYDVMTPRKGRDGRTHWTRIGSAFEGDKGINLVFDALPLPDAEGRCTASLFEPRQRDDGPKAPAQRAAGWDDDGDGVPF